MLRFLLGLVITVVGIPALLVFMLLDFSPDIPFEDYQVQEIPLIVQDEVNGAIDNLSDSELRFSLSESTINNIIFNGIRESANPEYNPGESCTTDACAFIDKLPIEGQEGAYIGITGAWVKLEDNIISLNIAAKAHYQIDLQTRLRLEFEVIDNADKFEISYHKVQVGNIPLPKAIVKPIVNAVLSGTNFDPESMNNEFFTTDMENLMILLDKNALVDEFSSSPAAQFGAKLVFGEELLQFNVIDDGDPRLELMFDLDRLETSNYQAPLNLGSETPQEVLDALMQEMATSALNDADPKVMLTEEDFNNLIYEIMPTVSLSDFLPADSAVEINVSMEKLYLDFQADGLTINLPILFNDRAMVAVIKATEDPTVTNGLMFRFTELSIGEDAGETIDQYLSVPYSEVQDLFSGMSISGDFLEFDTVTGTLFIPTSAIQSLLGSLATVDAVSYENEMIVVDFSVNLPF